MKAWSFLFLLPLFWACKRDKASPATPCDIEQARMINAAKKTTTQGLWGTVSFAQGNCLPMLPPGNGNCSHCPVSRSLLIYEYATEAQATAADVKKFYTAIRTPLVKQLQTDARGFYQVDLPPGTYTIVAVENGQLYSFGSDAFGGISPVKVPAGTQLWDLMFTYKVF